MAATESPAPPSGEVTVTFQLGYGIIVACSCGWRLNRAAAPNRDGAFKGEMPISIKRAREHNKARHDAAYSVGYL